MQINSYCDINYAKEIVFSSEEIEMISDSFVEYVIKNSLSKDFSSNYDYELEIMVCNNTFIQEINKTYRSKDKPTDVITFALYSDSETKIITDNKISLGQILISYDQVLTQAEENNISSQYEFMNLLAHGILHLLGFDHLDEKSLEYMLKLQNKMIESRQNVKV